MEFGAFASAATFDNSLSLKTGYGGGGRAGMFFDPRWSIEFEDAEMRASRPNGLRDVNVGILSGRLVAVPIISGSLLSIAVSASRTRRLSIDYGDLYRLAGKHMRCVVKVV